MTMSNMNAPSRAALRKCCALPEGRLRWINWNRGRNPRLDRIGGREVPLGAYVFEATPAVTL